jgi:hypothetical protein
LLSENPQFYRDLPLSSAYQGAFKSQPVENSWDKVYVLTSSLRQVFLDCGSQLRIFDNIWDMKSALVFKGSCNHAWTLSFSFLTFFSDVTGALEGETVVANSIPRIPLFGCYMESEQSQTRRHKQAQDWRDLIRELLEPPEGCLFISTTQNDGKERRLGKDT